MSSAQELLKTSEITGDEPYPLAPARWKLWGLVGVTVVWVFLGLVLTPVGGGLGLQILPLSQDTGTSLYAGGIALLLVLLALYLRRAHRALWALEQRVDRQRRRLRGMATDLEAVRSLLKVTASINSLMELSTLLRIIAREAARTLDANRSSVMLLDNSRTVLRTVAAYGVELDKVKGAEVRLGDGIAGWVAQYGKPRLLQGPVEAREFKAFQPKDRPIVSAVSVPLQVGGRVLGVLNATLTQEGRQFQDDELRLLMLYANHAAVAIRNASLLKASRERARLQAILEGYVSPQVARVLTQNPRGWMNLGELRDMTVLFADIRGFTAAVDRMGPQTVRSFLNEFFTRMTEIIFENHGTLDKFIGDSVMAFFGAPLRMEDHGGLAVRAALAMLSGFQKMQQHWRPRQPVVESLSLGVGISSGQVFVGNVGSTKRFDYTVIGQEVNVASRLCSMARGSQILVSENTRGLLGARFPLIHMGDVHFKGLDRPIHVFEVALKKN
jgi:adenylate cyclase